MTLSQHDVAGLFSPFSGLKEGDLPQPCRVGAPTRRGAPPTRRDGRFFALFQAKRGCPVAAMSRWKPNTTWLTSNTTWRASFRHFSSQKRVSCLSHVALEAQCDMAHLQHDVAGVFSPFSELKKGVMPQPCRVGGPMRRGALPTRRGARPTPKPQPYKLPLRCG